MNHYCRRCKRTPNQAGFSPDRKSATRLAYCCKDCTSELARLRYAANPEKYRGKSRAWRAVPENMAKHVVSHAKWLADNAERVRVMQKARSFRWYVKNRKKSRANSRQWAKDNAARVAANIAARDATKILATPRWADHEKIRTLYEDARRLSLETGIGHCVDHIVPLRGRTVSGLHWEGNLQVITVLANRAKHNTFWPGM